MSTTEVLGDASGTADVRNTDMKLEVLLIPVSDVDRAKRFYTGLGWRLDADISDGGISVVQLTPPGSGCSVMFGRHLTPAAPGSAQGMHLIVSDIQAARDELAERGVEITDVYHCASGYACRFPGAGGTAHHAGTGDRVDGPAPGRVSYGSFASFTDPDGNGWVLQEITTRLPGRVDSGVTGFASAGDLASALRRAAAAHGEHEARTGGADPNWPDWYAAYLVAEQAGTPLPT